MGKCTQRKILLNSIIVALLFSSNAITWVLNINNAIVMIMAFIVGLYMFCGNSLFPKYVLPLSFYVLVFFVMSLYIDGNNETLQLYFLEFILMGVVALIFSQVKIDVDTVIIALCFISIPVAPFIMRIDFLGESNYGQWMGVSYGSIKFIVALLYALCFIKMKKTLKILLIFPLIFYTVFFLSFGSRGAIVGVLTFIILASLIKLGKSFITNLTIVVSIIFLSIVFFLPMINYLANLMGQLGIEFYAIDKILAFADSERGIDNGRSERIVLGLSMFSDSPLWGNGIASFEKKFGIGYVHNLFVQQLVEGGILLFIPLTIVLIKAVSIVLSNHYDSDVRMFLAFLICCNVVELLFSNYCWRIQGYWYLIGYVLPYMRIKRKPNR